MNEKRFIIPGPAVCPQPTKKVSYGRPLLRKLVREASLLGITVNFYIDEDGQYIIRTIRDMYAPPTAAAACHFVMGMIELARVRHMLFPSDSVIDPRD